jgi:uncharacterized cupredoxin-like copper-binding protein
MNDARAVRARGSTGEGIRALPRVVLVCAVLGGLVFRVPVATALPTVPAPPRAVVRVDMKEFAFTPRVIALSAGRPARLAFTNRGEIAHQFTTDYLSHETPALVVSETLHVETRGLEVLRLAPGAWAWVDFLPRRPGRFPFSCTIEGHQEAGMHGVLLVR